MFTQISLRCIRNSGCAKLRVPQQEYKPTTCTVFRSLWDLEEQMKPYKHEAHAASCAVMNEVLCLWPRNFISSAIYGSLPVNLQAAVLDMLASHLSFLLENNGDD